MNQSFKKQIDEKVNHSVELINELNTRLPWFFQQWNSQFVDRRAFVPLTDKSDVEDYIRTITDMQDVSKNHHMDIGEIKQCSRETLKFVTEQFQILVQAYDIQGRMIEAMCEKLDVDPDIVLGEWALHNHKEAQYDTKPQQRPAAEVQAETQRMLRSPENSTEPETNNQSRSRLPFGR